MMLRPMIGHNGGPPLGGPFAFYVGTDRLAHVHRFARVCLSIRALATRRKPLGQALTLLDSGGFNELELHGEYQAPPAAYARRLRELLAGGVVNIEAAAAQDYMCALPVLKRTGLSVATHQRLTIERLDALRDCDAGCPILPTLQGLTPADYARHAEAYGDRLQPGAWVGVGSVARRSRDVVLVTEILAAIHQARPGLRLHGWGLKLTSLKAASVREQLASADSAAWSYSARKQGRSPHDWREAQAFAEQINTIAAKAPEPWQIPLILSRESPCYGQ